MMPVQNFTDRGVRALPIPTSGQVDYFDAGRKPAGFGVRISYKGTRAWIFIYRYNGVKRRMKLALVDEIGLKRLTENELSYFSRLWHDGCGETIIGAQDVDRNHSPKV